VSAFGFAAEFRQDAAGGFRVQERDLHSFGPGTRIPVDQLHPLRSRIREGRGQILHRKGNVMDPLSPLFDEHPDGSGRIGAFEQFNLRTTDKEECGSDFLVRDIFHCVAAKPQNAFVVLPRLVDAADGDADVFDVGNGHGESFEFGVSYSPKTSRNVLQISPIVAYAFTASRIGGIRLASDAAAVRSAESRATTAAASR
jgi:hypothetical protein